MGEHKSRNFRWELGGGDGDGRREMMYVHAVEVRRGATVGYVCGITIKAHVHPAMD